MEHDRSDCFPLNFKPTEFYLTQTRYKNCHHDRNPLDFKGTVNLFFECRMWSAIKRPIRKLFSGFCLAKPNLDCNY